MDVTRINLQSQVVSLLGNAYPKPTSRQSLSCKQEFLGTPIFPVRRVLLRTATVVRTYMPNIISKAKQKITHPISKISELKKKYFKPNKVRLFNSNDKLNGQIDLNLNPTRSSGTECKTIKEALKNGSLTLELGGLLDIWHGKLVNPKYYHLKKFVKGFGCIDFKNYILSGVERIFGFETPIISKK